MAMAMPNICSCSSLGWDSSRPCSISPRLGLPQLQSRPISPAICKSRGPALQILQKWRRAARYLRFEVAEGQEPHIDESDDSLDDKLDDSVLPPNVEGAVLQSSQSSANFISAGGMRAIVELLLPELEFLNDEGSQEELWKLARLYLEALKRDTGIERLKAIFPDAGAAALLKHCWKDANFSFASLNDRKPVVDDDEIIVMIIPDYQMLQDVERIASILSNNLPRPLVMWNPRLVSGDVGIGLNVRRLREYFLSTFTVVYSMRPLPFGAIFRCYPGLWLVFLDDKERPGRYVLAKEQLSRPTLDDLDELFLVGQSGNADKKPSFFVEVTTNFLLVSSIAIKRTNIRRRILEDKKIKELGIFNEYLKDESKRRNRQNDQDAGGGMDSQHKGSNPSFEGEAKFKGGGIVVYLDDSRYKADQIKYAYK